MSDTIENRFAGRTAIVTGAGAGIGRATASRLAREGARVVASDISEERLKALVAESGDLPLHPVAGDIASDTAVGDLVTAAEDRVDVLVNNVMAGAGAGAIVNVSSEAGFRASASGVAYAASSAAVNSLTRSTALFYRQQGIRCNAVAPGPVATSIEAPWRSTLAGEVLGPIMRATLPPIARPEELAAAITWLASDEASNVNGVVLASDGGWSAL